MTDLELAWLAGLLEGEGSFIHGPPCEPNTPRICLEMTDRDVVEKAARLLGVKYIHTSTRGVVGKNWSPSYRVLLRSKAAVVLMEKLLPHMGARRAQRIREVLARYKEGMLLVKTRVKLTPEIAKALRERKAAHPTLSISQLARELQVSRPTVRDVLEGVTWR